MQLNMHNLLKLKYILPILLGLAPTFAFAVNLFEPSSGDISLKVLGALFGGLLDSGGSDPLMDAIKMFNGGILIIGGILAAYTILAGTLGTAHDGEMLGKKFSSVWIPIRYSVGTALVLPVIGGGYCIMQAIVMWLVVQGVGLADQVWISYMSNPVATAVQTQNSSVKTDILSVAEQAFKSSMCQLSYKKVVEEEGITGGFLGWSSKYVFEKRQTSVGHIYGDTNTIFSNDVCGSVLYPRNKNEDITIVNNTPSTYQGYLGTFGDIFSPMDVSSINTAHNTQLDLLVQKMETLAGKVIAEQQGNGGISSANAENYYKEIYNAGMEYDAQIKAASAGLVQGDAFEKIKAAASNQGWILAGAWFTRIIQMNQTMNAAINSTPTLKQTEQNSNTAMFEDAKPYLRATDAVMKFSTLQGELYPVVNNEQKGGQTSAKAVEVNGALKRIQAGITEAITTVNLYELKNDPRHPIIMLNDLGNRLSVVCQIIMGTLAGIAAILSAFPGASGAVTNVLMILNWFVDVPVKILMGTAMGTQYILPTMPFIIWIGCVVGWVLLVIEAIIAAPLWAIMHLHPNGDDLTGRGGNGYMLVLSLLLRPVLMIFGVIAAIIISAVIGEFINKTFFEVFAQSTGAVSGFSALISLSMGTLLYFIIMFIFIKKCFGIMHQLPDQLLKWIGGGDQALGQFAGEFGSASESGARAGAALGGFTASSVGKLGAKTIGGHVENMRNMTKQAGSQEGISGNNLGITGRKLEGAGAIVQSSDGNYRTPSANTAFSQQQLQQGVQAGDIQLTAFQGDSAIGNRDSMMSGLDLRGQDNSPNHFKSAYNSSMVGAHQTANGDKAVAQASTEAISSQFAAARMDGFSNYGGSATQAMKDIGHSVNMGHINDRLSNYSGASSLVQQMSGKNYVDANNYASAIEKIGSENPQRASEIIQVVNQEKTISDKKSAFADALKNYQ